MSNKSLLLLLLLFASGLFAQESNSLYQTKKVATTKDTIYIENNSINPLFFKLLDKSNKAIDSLSYKIDFSKGILVLNKSVANQHDTVTVRYLKYPSFLTKTYSFYDDSKVVHNANGEANLYRIANDNFKKFTPFDGLNTSGSITRGITIGNNQNAVVNSNLDLQITGKISDKVSLRASIQDSNIPLQNGGYSQKLDQFDQIFMELYSDKWSVRGGDLFLENRQSKFLNFNKKVQGLSGIFRFGTDENKTTVFASGAIVKGQYAKSSFTGQEGNQGPYKLRGQNGELYILVISGSERVYVNGILLKRGENNDYVIDYNAGEIRFTTLYPINSEMRIVIEYQYSDRNYTRFVTYGGATHETKKWSIGGAIYSESDVKNQPLQQNLSTEQVQILTQAGDNPDLMTAPSAYADAYSTNKILYKKTTLNGATYFEYSNVSTDELYNVTFSFVGDKLGNYNIINSVAIGKIYQYVPPIAGVKQGSYEPITRLTPPIKLQIATIQGKFTPSEKTLIDYELGVSDNDKNLYSSIDDGDNKGMAGKINLKQRLFSKKIQVDYFSNYQWVQKNFRTIERLFTIEFNRDWNLSTFSGNQSYLITGVTASLPDKGKLTYQFEKLDFSETFSGNRHVYDFFSKYNKITFQSSGSVLKSDGSYSASTFIRNQSKVKFNFHKNWIGSSFRMENNKEKLEATQSLSNLSQRYNEIGSFIGRGDSTKVFVETGFLHRTNDSLQNGILQRVNASNSFYVNTKPIKNDRTDLSMFVNYRTLTYENNKLPSENSLNSRILFNTRFWDQLLQSTTAYETTSGTIAQQQFTYLEVQAGQGVYMWKDYNNNGIQELQEFEVAPFPDLAKYVRVFLPNQVFIKTHQNKFSQSLILNPNQWQNKVGLLKLASYFYNQTNYLIEKKVARNSSNFDLNPFAAADENLLGLNTTFRNSLFLNRGKQRHSVTYTFLKNQTKNLLSVGAIESKNSSHQWQYAHLIEKTWLMAFSTKTIRSVTSAENYASRNFELEGYQLAPKISYLFTKNTSLDVFFEYQTKANKIGNLENLKQSRLGASFTLSTSNKFTSNGEFSMYNNAFIGNEVSPVAFQMLEGLQPGKNTTWRLLIQKNLTQYLDINLNYQGRKSETSQTIHTGNVQLRAYF